MSPEQRNTLLIAAGLLVAVLAFLLWPQVSERLEPSLDRAWVAIEVEGEGIARAGSAALAAGQPFRLHAVLEGRDGAVPVYYTGAPRLEVGGEEVPPERLLRWDRARIARVRWFTVEGRTPYLEVASPEALAGFQFEELFRADWPAAWSVAGSVVPRHGVQRAGPGGVVPDFGTQRFHVRIELFDREESLTPALRFRSPGAAEVLVSGSELPAVVASLPGAAGPASRAFGLTQLEPAAEVPPEVATEITTGIADLTARGFAFSRRELLAATVREAGADPAALEWRAVDVATGKLPWGTDVAPGDLLQSGKRTVILARDAGEPGVLDPADLALDFARGAKLLPLAAIFTGDGGLRLEWASLSGR